MKKCKKTKKDATLQQIVGENIHWRRKAYDLTQEALAQKAKIHANHLGGIERGERNMTLETLEKIAKALNTPPAKFLKPHNLELKFR